MAIDEIIVTAPRVPNVLPSDFYASLQIPAPPVRDPDVNRAFIPPVLPVPIEEIVVTAKPPPVRPPPVSGSVGVWGGIAILLGLTAAELMRQLSEQKLDAAYWDWWLLAPRRPPVEIPVKPVVGPGDSEVTVKVAPPPPQRAPQPVFFDPDLDPWEMVPVYPVTYTPPAPAPTPTAPAVPQPQPLEIPQPLATPRNTPYVNPLPLPIGSPFLDPLPQPYAKPTPTPQARPQVRPLVSPTPQPTVGPGPTPFPLTVGQPGTLPLPQEYPLPLTQPQPTPASQCPPCPRASKRERKEPREACYRKLVKEGRYEDLDQVYEWAEIDCDTGKELPANYLEDY